MGVIDQPQVEICYKATNNIEEDEKDEKDVVRQYDWPVSR